MNSDTPSALILDVSNLASRAYHVAASGQGEKSVIGLARHGLKKMIQTLLRECEPLRIIGAVDEGPCFRHRLLPPREGHAGYKGNRPEKPEEMRQLRSEAAELLKREFGVEILAAADGEADDVIATVCNQMLPYGWRLGVASNDADLMAVVTGRHGDASGVFMLQYHRGTYHSLDAFGVEASKMGVPPHKVALFKALSGDAGDNYGGCPSIGPVAARRLALANPSMTAIFNNLGDPMKVCSADAKKLSAFGLENALLMERLATLDIHARLIAR